jgi:hypothetical protein
MKVVVVAVNVCPSASPSTATNSSTATATIWVMPSSQNAIDGKPKHENGPVGGNAGPIDGGHAIAKSRQMRLHYVGVQPKTRIVEERWR